MAINKINDGILNRQVTHDSVNKATSGKKDIVKNSDNEFKRTSLEDKLIFSQDAQRLQETEAILQNALQRLHEMDELTENDVLGIKERIDGDFYSHKDVLERVIDDIFPEQQIRNKIEKRMKAESYVPELNRFDDIETIDQEKLNKIRDRIDSGFYISKEVFDKIADDLVNMLEV